MTCSNAHIRILLALLAAMILAGTVRSADNTVSISGVVRSKSGSPAEGAFVRWKHLERGVAFTVFTQAQGRYMISGLPSGKYMAQAWVGGYENNRVPPVEIGNRTSVDLELATPQGAQDALTTAALAQALPEGNFRYVLVGGCTECHSNRDRSLFKIVSSRKTFQEWKETVQKMRDHPYGFPISLHVSDSERDAVALYLAEHFGPDAPAVNLERYVSREAVRGPAAKALFVEYDMTPGSEPHDVGIDSHSIAWATHGYHGTVSQGALFRIDPESHTYTYIPVPESEKSGSNGVEIDKRDGVWVSDGTNSRLLRYDPVSHQFAIFMLPRTKSGGGANANTIRIGRDGMVWGTEISNNRIVRVDQKTKEAVEYVVPAGAARHANASPYGMAIAGDGSVWFAERFTDKLGRVDPATGKITEYDIPTKHSDVRRGAADADGNVWFGACGTSKLVKADYRTGKITEFMLPTRDSCPYSVDIDRKHSLIWVGEMTGDKLARFDPANNSWVEFPFPTHYASVRRIEVDQNRANRVWIAERGVGVDKVGYLEILP